MASRLSVQGLQHSYGDTVALRNGDLEVAPGELTALLGPSGSGKSTLLAAVAGMIRPKAGRILLGDRDLVPLPAEARRLGMVFQDYALWPHMRVQQNVAMPLNWRGVGRAEALKRADRALERVGLQQFGRRRPSELSGGQQQRVALARAVVAEPELLLLDEPLSALDPDTRASVRTELAELLRSLGITTILVTHDRDDAFELADRVAVLIGGSVVQHGTPQEVFERPASVEAARFLGVSVLNVRGVARGEAEIAGQRIRVPDSAPLGDFTLVVREGGVKLADSGVEPAGVIRARLISHRFVAGGYRLRVGIDGLTDPLTLHADAPVTDSELLLHVPVSSMHIVSAAAAAASQGNPRRSENVP